MGDLRLAEEAEQFRSRTVETLNLIDELNNAWEPRRQRILAYFAEYSVAAPANDQALKVAVHSMRLNSPFFGPAEKATSRAFLRSFSGG